MSDPAGERDGCRVAGAGQVARPPARLREIDQALVVEGVVTGHLLEFGPSQLQRPELEVEAGNDEIDIALAGGNETVVALVISAEATAAAGRPAEARRLASRALELADLSVSDVFAGMPRASIWPIEPGAPTVAEPLFGAEAAAVAAAAGDAVAHPAGLWDDAPGVDLPDPQLALEAGRTALGDGRIGAAALHLALALRLAPALAPAVLDALAPYDAPELALVKGDAYRLVGHERDARLAFAEAAASIPAPATTQSRKERS